VSTLEEIEQDSMTAAPAVVPEQGRVAVEHDGTVHLWGIVVGGGPWTGLRVRTALGTVVEVELEPDQETWSLDFDARIVGSGEHALALQLRDGLTTVATEVVRLLVNRYEPPRVRLVQAPRRLTTFDGFDVRGAVEGSDVDGERVSVSVGGVTRSATVRGGRFDVHFEDDVLDHGSVGVRPLVASVTDRRGNMAKETVWVPIDEFHAGHVHLDPLGDVVMQDARQELTVTGELALGTHVDGRELVVLLVTADAEELVVATGTVADGWEHGELVADIPVGALARGRYRVRAVLTDPVSPRLLRSDVSAPFTLVPFGEAGADAADRPVDGRVGTLAAAS
jgi:hypothetical protein